MFSTTVSHLLDGGFWCNVCNGGLFAVQSDCLQPRKYRRIYRLEWSLLMGRWNATVGFNRPVFLVSGTSCIRHLRFRNGSKSAGLPPSGAAAVLDRVSLFSEVYFLQYTCYKWYQRCIKMSCGQYLCIFVRQPIVVNRVDSAGVGVCIVHVSVSVCLSVRMSSCTLASCWRSWS